MGLMEMVQNGNKSGFLLLEILISFLFMSSIALVIASFQGQAAQIHGQTNKRLEALSFARNYLEAVVAHQPNLKIPDNYKITRKNVSKYTNRYFKPMKVTISWHEKESTQSISFDTGIVQ